MRALRSILLALLMTTLAAPWIPSAHAEQCFQGQTYSTGVRETDTCTGDTVWAGTCGGIGAGAGLNSDGLCVHTCGGGIETDALSRDECIHTCASTGVGGIGVQATPGTSCIGGVLPTLANCALYLDMTVSPPIPKYPGQAGVVIDYPPAGYHVGDGDVALCAAPCALPPYGAIVDNTPYCFPTPVPCSLPGPGWTVGLTGVACVGAPWVGVRPTPPGTTPSTCPGAATIGITVYWGTTPLVGGPAWDAFCF